MPKKVPKKNIDDVLVDVRKPDYDYKRVPKLETVDLTRVPEAPIPRFSEIKKFLPIFLTGILIIFISISIGFFVNLSKVKSFVSSGSSKILYNFSNSVSAIRTLQLNRASEPLKRNTTELISLQNILKDSYSQTVLQFLDSFIPSFKGSGNILNEISGLNIDFLELTTKLSKLQNQGLKDFQTNGEALISNLQSIRDLIKKISSRVESIRNIAAQLKNTSSFFGRFEYVMSEEYLKYTADFHQIDVFLESFINFLKNEEKHVVLLFQNTAEIRPGGGFVGSYADLTIGNGQLKKIDVRDIYDPDGQLDIKVVPPSEIKTMSKNFGARDANWFFDFPTSAKTILFFLEQSKIYSERSVSFDGVIGMNLSVFEDVLDVLGPIPLEEYKLVITKENFLKEIQREVESGEDKEQGEPKRILKVLAPKILERLQILPQDKQEALMNSLKERILNKDLMFFMKDNNMQAFVKSFFADGGVYEIPNGFWGAYLAVANANVAGGKTDAFIKQSIDIKIDLDTSGGSFVNLLVEREHFGHNEKDPWWKVTNKNFIKILTNPNTTLVSLKGNDVKNLVSKFDYEESGYSKIPELEEIEQSKIFSNLYKTWSMKEFGKNSFGTWFNVGPGDSKILDVKYQTSGNDEFLARSGKIYTFVFDKQSGVNSSLDVGITAPFGFRFAESKSMLFSKSFPTTDGRILIDLTLEKQ